MVTLIHAVEIGAVCFVLGMVASFLYCRWNTELVFRNYQHADSNCERAIAVAREWKEKAEAEQRRADLALDRLVALTTAAPPVSKPGIEERQEALTEQRRRESDLAELFAPETGTSPTAEMETTDRIA